MLKLAWPWVSRGAYDAVVDERERLRAQVDGLVDDLVRLARREHSLPERKPEQRKREAIKPLPTELRNLISGFASPAIQQQMEYEIRNQLRLGADPEVLSRQLRESLGVMEA